MAALEAPAVQIWGWPGTGKSGILARLAGEKGSLALSIGDTESAAGWKAALRLAGEKGASWVVLAAPPSPEALARAVRWLPAGLRLAFAGVDRAELPLRTAYVYPPELWLEPEEVREVWRAAREQELAPESIATLRAATDGWLRPLRHLAASGRDLPEAPTADALLELAALDGFFRSEVLPALPALGLERQGDDADETDKDDESWIGSGLALGDEANPRLPRLLESWLRKRKGSPEIGGLRATGTAWPIQAARRPPGPSPAEADGASERSATEPERPSFRVTLFGRPRVDRLTPEGEVAIRFPLRRAFELLAYLASSPDLSASREELIEEIWSGESPADVQRNFHPTLSYLRRSLSADLLPRVVPLLHAEGIYRLNPAVDWRIDRVELAAAYERARSEAPLRPEAAVEHLRRAWSLYRGSFLPRVEAEWAGHRRDESQRIYLELLKLLGDLELKLGRSEAALDAYRALLAEDPLEERVHVAVMRLYAEQGRRDLVRRQYDRLCNLLLGELGLEPLDETTREFHQLMA